MMLGLATSFGAHADMVQVNEYDKMMVGNFVTGPGLYNACVAEINGFGMTPTSYELCGSPTPIPPGNSRHALGGWFTKQVGDKLYGLRIDAWACENSKTIRYFPESRKCIPIIPLTTPVPANPKANGQSCSKNGPHDRQPTCGNPIAIGTGNKVQVEVDYAAATPGMPLESVRVYNGGAFAGDTTAKGLFGNHWSHSLDRKIVLKPNQVPLECFRRIDNDHVFCTEDLSNGTGQTAIITRADGKVFRFKQVGNQWNGEADIDDRLTAEYGADGVTPVAWTFITASQDQEKYSADGKLLSVTARTGLTQRFTYSTGTTNDTSAARWPEDAPVCTHIQAGAALPAGLPMCVTDHWGRQMQFEYDSKNRVAKAIDPANQAYLYEYDGPSGGCLGTNPVSPSCSSDNLTAVTYPGGKKRIYHYNEAGMINNGGFCYGAINTGNGFGHLVNALTGITDENGVRFASWGWDCLNRAISSQHAGGVEKVTLVHGNRATDGSNTVAVTSYSGTAAAPQSITRNYHFKLSLGIPKNDTLDQPCDDCGGTLERTYDVNNNVLTSKDWLGNKKVFTYDMSRNLETSRTEAQGTPLARTISTEWHPTMRLRTKVAEPLRITSYTYDSNGNMLTESVQATSDVNGSAGFQATPVGAPRTWTFTYSAIGQLLTKVGPGVNTTLTYDSEGNLATVTNAASHVTHYSNYDAHGRVGQITDPNGLVTSFTYGPRGWLDSMSVGGELTSYTYDAVGNLKTVTLPDGSTVTYAYDGAHRLTDIIDSFGNKITYTLDLVGNRIGEETKDASGALTRKVARVFDTFNRLKQVTGALQ